MKANESLAKIPVVSTIKSHDVRGLRWRRQAFQAAAILALILIPATGIFRIDVGAGFIVLDRQIWFSDFSIVFGFWLAVACTMILVYSSVGTAFCGWVCPQNTFSTIANSLTAKHLGKRAVVDWENSDRAKLASRKNNVLNWFLLSGKLFLISMGLALIPLFYFFPPDTVWAFVTLTLDHAYTDSIYWIYGVFVFIILVNLAVIRHFVCRYMCIYRMWQFLFKTKDTLHIEYDETRSADCEKCNYCQTNCMVEIDPRNTSTFDSCTNCGACITACDTIHEKQGELGLLKFKLGPRKKGGPVNDGRRSVAKFRDRLIWVIPVWVLGVGMFAYGLASYDTYHLAVYKAEESKGSQIETYRINLASKIFEPGTVSISIEGLTPEQYKLDKSFVDFQTADRRDAFITLNKLPAGLHSFLVKAESNNGWNASFRIQHFVSEG